MSDEKPLQIDLFLESIVDLPMKGERRLLEFPFFPIAKTPRREEMVFEDPRAGVSITVAPGHAGMATIYDKDILYYMATLINARVERGEGLTADRHNVFRINAYDLLRSIGRGTGGQEYRLLEEALDRLQSTSVRTSVATGHDGIDAERSGFSWIDKYKVIERRTSRGKRQKIAAAIEIHMNEWLMRAIVEDRSVLTINPGYFRLKGGLERRLYELARKHCGRQQRWVIGLDRLRAKCGTSQELRFFKRDLKAIVLKQSLPDYEISLAFDKASKPLDLDDATSMRRWGSNERILVVFTRRYDEILPNYANPAPADGEEVDVVSASEDLFAEQSNG